MNAKRMMTGDFLYHPVHGMCRIDRLIQEGHSGKEELSYSLVPKVMSGMKVRFVIAAEQMEASGFHGLLSIKEARDILAYLRAGDYRAAQTRQTWLLAQNILSYCSENFPVREQRKRQTLDYSVKGLIGELACVFKITLREAADMVRKIMRDQHPKNSSVITALARAVED